MTKLRKRAGAVLASLSLAVGISIVAVLPARADSQRMQVCNSSASDTNIYVYLIKGGGGGGFTVPPGICAYGDPDSYVRVDVETNGSYKLGEIGGGYGPCHDGPNYASDPADRWDAVRYRTYLNEGC